MTMIPQVCEALANIIVAFIGRQVLEKGGTQNLPMKFFGLAGVAQVCAKSFTLEALKNGLSFPVVTLAKSGKVRWPFLPLPRYPEQSTSTLSLFNAIVLIFLCFFNKELSNDHLNL